MTRRRWRRPARTTPSAAGDWSGARAALLRLWSASPTPATVPFVVSRFEKLRGHVPLTQCKMAVLRSFTVEPLIPVVRAAVLAGGIDLEVRAGAFNTIAQEVLDSGSWVYSYGADVIVVAAQMRDLSPALRSDFAEPLVGRGGGADQWGRRAFRAVALDAAVGDDGARHRARVAVPADAGVGVLDCRNAPGQLEAIERVNQRLRRARVACV